MHPLNAVVLAAPGQRADRLDQRGQLVAEKLGADARFRKAVNTDSLIETLHRLLP